MVWTRGVKYARQRTARLLADEHGQDLVEYALLTGLVAVAGMLLFPTIQSSMADAYEGWNSNAQAIWEPPPPI